jgi:ketosteroid isomerase-like protein
MDAARDELWAAVCAIYDAFLAGDRAAIDARISPDATLWDAFHEPLLRGRRELDALRDARPADGPVPSALVPSEPAIDVYGDVGVVRHVLTVSYDDAPAQRVRNTSVWRLVDGAWLCVHNHEDLRP